MHFRRIAMSSLVALLGVAASGPVLAAGDDPGEREQVAGAPEDVTPTTQAAKAAKSGKSGKSGKSKAKEPAVDLGGLLQARWFTGMPWRNGDPTGDQVGTEWRNSFQITRARVDLGTKVKGWKLKTKFGFDKGVVKLFNAYAERDLPAGLELRVGQFKRIQSQTYNISADEMQPLERPEVVDDAGASSRDIGLAVGGAWLDDRLLAAVAALNGNGPNLRENDNTNLRLEARVDAAPLGEYDLETHPIGDALRLRLGVGAALYREPARRKDKAGHLLTEADEAASLAVFGAIKAFGVELRGEYFSGTIEPVDVRSAAVAAQTPLPVAARTWRGGYGQIAVDLPRDLPLQVVGVVERWQPDVEPAAGATPEPEALRVHGTLNWYLKGDKAKLALAWQRELVDGGDQPDHRRDTAFVQLLLGY